MKFPKRFLVVLTLVLTGLVLIACKPGEETVVDASPTFAGVGAASIKVYDEFDPLAGVTATDPEDGSLTSSINVKSNNVDNTVIGTYQVVYEVLDSAGNRTQVTRTVNVTALDEQDYPLAQYLSGVDLSKLPGEQKAILFAAAERYLLDNVYAGVPLYTRATRVMYSDRVQLFSPEYNGVLGFGTAFSQLSADDSTVKMFGDTFGTAGEYTWRASFNTDPTGLNPWMADDSNTSTFTDHFNGALYDFFFDESKTGYEILPSLAKSEPIPVNPTVINGKTYAKVWQIEIRDDLQWKYHPSTNVSALPAGHEVLNAEDYLWTWRYALENNWFRARTGGGDFVSQGIKNAAEFLAGNATWAEVGLRLATGKTNTIELEYVNEKSTFEIKYGFAGAVLTPINQQLFEALGDQYGMDPTKVASSGIYYFDTWTPGQLLTFKKNNLHPDAALYKYTGYQYRYVNGSDNIFAEFLAGRLESASVPASQINNYLNDPRVKTAPDATTWRLMINGFGSTDARDAYIAANPGVGIDDTWEPEPILSYLPMRQALFYGFDRYHAAVELVKLYLPAHTLFAPTYFIDAESGLSVRGTDAGQAVFDDFGGGSDGYFPDAAKDLFIDAVTEAIADGHYTAGTATNYTVITLQLYWSSSGNTSAQMMVANLIEQYEALLVDDVNFVRLDIVENDVAFPNNYYDYMMVAKMDLGIGGISGSLLDAPSFMDVFSDDNRGGFTLNWGIDTTTANIPVAYENLEGKMVYEKWGFNALIEALTGRIYVKNGMEQDAWTNAADLINAYLDMAGEELETSTDGAELAGYALPDSFEDIIADNGFDSLEAFIVVTKTGKNYLFVVSKTDADYKLYQQSALFTTAEAAISNDLASYGAYVLVESDGPLTDAEIAANAYIADVYGYTSVAEVAADFGIPVAYTEVYAISWASQSSSNDDGYVVLHIGNYYIAVAWL
ncbi:MAG TPA: ABC transporter substrate-binding protein [Acholeplasmataceae bacterium]|nr:ABC transporter substrate-binding protein [Acholeplasmataceae bacterium]